MDVWIGGDSGGLAWVSRLRSIDLESGVDFHRLAGETGNVLGRPNIDNDLADGGGLDRQVGVFQLLQ